MAALVLDEVSEAAILRAIAEGELKFPPVTFRLEKPPLGLVEGGADGILQAEWNGQKSRFVFDCKTRWTPRVIQDAVRRLKGMDRVVRGVRALLIVPYLPEDRMLVLAEAGISGIDLCGNGLLVDPPRLYVYRTGAKNLYKQSAPIRGIYDSANLASIVTRVFLLQPRFASIGEVLSTCHVLMLPTEQRQPLTKPTVSKVVRQLEEELVVSRRRDALHLSDPVRLIDQLHRHFAVPPGPSRFLGRADRSSAAAWAALRQLPNLRAVATGRSSAGVHAGLAVPDRLQIYVSNLQVAVDALRATPTQAFPNVELIETDQQPVYFDARPGADAVWASPIQTYLELAEGSAREADAAKQLRAELLRRVQSALAAE